MNRSKNLSVVFLLCFVASAKSQASLSGTIESYFLNSTGSRGFVNQLWWGQLQARFSDRDLLTGSYIVSSGAHRFDELAYSHEAGPATLKLGRIRTRFGLSDWSDLFYNGFNHLPLVRSIPLVEDLGLSRDDSGAEGTLRLNRTEIKMAIFDDNLGKDQILPDRLQTETLRIQQNIGNLIAAGNLLTSGKGDQKIYGLDFRYTFPQVIVRGEAFWGVGDDAAQGFYTDVSYRLPKFFRTQLVGRYDQVDQANQPVAHLETFGIRQIVNRYLSINLNYAFGSHLTQSSEYGSQSSSVAPTGWSARAMFQYSF